VRTFSAGLLFLAACFSSRGTEPPPDVDAGTAGGVDAGEPGGSDAGEEPAMDAGQLVDVGPLLVDAGPCAPPRGDEFLLLEEEAECLGLVEAVCASCHVRSEGARLRPIGVPPPPEATPPVDPACLLPSCE